MYAPDIEGIYERIGITLYPGYNSGVLITTLYSINRYLFTRVVVDVRPFTCYIFIYIFIQCYLFERHFVLSVVLILFTIFRRTTRFHSIY